VRPNKPLTSTRSTSSWASSPKTPDDNRLWGRYAGILPHAVSPVTMLAACRDRDLQAFALEMVRYLYRFGDQQAGRNLAERLIEKWTTESGPDYDRVLDARRRLADALREAGHYPAAYSETVFHRRGQRAVASWSVMGSRGTNRRDRRLLLVTQGEQLADLRPAGGSQNVG
jgi:hypothetical protein